MTAASESSTCGHLGRYVNAVECCERLERATRLLRDVVNSLEVALEYGERGLRPLDATRARAARAFLEELGP